MYTLIAYIHLCFPLLCKYKKMLYTQQCKSLRENSDD